MLAVNLVERSKQHAQLLETPKGFIASSSWPLVDDKVSESLPFLYPRGKQSWGRGDMENQKEEDRMISSCKCFSLPGHQSAYLLLYKAKTLAPAHRKTEACQP